MVKDHSIEIGSCRPQMENQWDGQVECRICQEEEEKFNLEAPCACSGSVKYAHRKCVQRWCNEKGSTVCEICRQPYQSGYTANSCSGETERTSSIHLRNQWVVGEDLHEFAEQRFWGLDEENFSEINSATAASCRSAAIILLSLLLLRHLLALVAAANEEEDYSLLFILFLLRVSGILLPCFIIARAISIFQQKKRRQNEEAMTAADAGTSNTRRVQARGISSPLLFLEP